MSEKIEYTKSYKRPVNKEWVEEQFKNFWFAIKTYFNNKEEGKPSISVDDDGDLVVKINGVYEKILTSKTNASADGSSSGSTIITKSDLAALEDKIEEIENSISSIQNNTSTNEEIENLTATVVELQNSMSEANSTIENLATTVTELQNSMSEANSTIESLTTTATNLQNSISKANSTIETLTTRVADLEEQVANMTQTVVSSEEPSDTDVVWVDTSD